MKTVVRYFIVLAALVAISITGSVVNDRVLAAEPFDESGRMSFKLTTLNGDEFNTDELRGKVLVVNFWASWCGPCRLEADTLEHAYKVYKPRGVEFVGVAVQDEAESARNFIEEYGVTYPNGIDQDGLIGRTYNIYIVPMTIVLDKYGREVSRHPGMIRPEPLKKAIHEALLKSSQ